jgi:nucleoside-diphosphate-sugar epimerase
MKKALVFGAGGFIGHHLVNKLKDEGYFVRGVDIKLPKYAKSKADEFFQYDLIYQQTWNFILDARNPRRVNFSDKQEWFDEIYQLAADMGGAGYVFTGNHDADIMYNSSIINLHLCKTMLHYKVPSKVFYSSSACIYPEREQPNEEGNYHLEEEMAYPASPDSEYGWEKLFSERLYRAFNRNHNLDVRIARLHNVYGPMGAWNNGREKSPAALCRKIIQSDESINIWGDGKQIRSYLYIDDCLDAIKKLMESDYEFPINIGSPQGVTVDNMIDIISTFENKELKRNYIEGPRGVQARASNNDFVTSLLKWLPTTSLTEGLQRTYNWIKSEIAKGNNDADET